MTRMLLLAALALACVASPASREGRRMKWCRCRASSADLTLDRSCLSPVPRFCLYVQKKNLKLFRVS